MLCVRGIGQPAKFHRADVAKMHACTKHMAKEKVGTSSTNIRPAFSGMIKFLIDAADRCLVYYEQLSSETVRYYLASFFPPKLF